MDEETLHPVERIGLMRDVLGFPQEQLHIRGYRLTPQRYLVFQVIREAEAHLSVEQIAERVRAFNPCVSLSTIYRTLELLRTLGLIHETHLPEEPVTYETWEGQVHHHLLCRGCRAVIHLPPPLLGTLQRDLQDQYHFEEVSLELIATGYCEACWKDRQRE